MENGSTRTANGTTHLFPASKLVSFVKNVLAIDIFCSVLSRMPWGPQINKMYGELDEPRKLGHFIMVVDIKRLMPLDLFKRRLGEMLKEFGALPPAEGFERVYYPGQIEAERRQQKSVEGIPVDPGLTQELEGLGKRFNIPFPA